MSQGSQARYGLSSWLLLTCGIWLVGLGAYSTKKPGLRRVPRPLVRRQVVALVTA